MRAFSRAGLLVLLLLTLLPAGAAACPEGTRNNYKGECVPIPSPNEDAQEQREEVQSWIEPDTDASGVEGVAPEDNIEDAVGGSNTGSVVIVEEVVTADEDAPLTQAVEKSVENASVTTDLISAQSTIQQLREEIKDLLNRVELQRYELEKLRGRQRDLYDDLDQRLRKQERLALTVPPPVMPSVDSVVIAPETVISSDPTSSTEPNPMVTGANLPSPNARPIAQDSIETEATVTIDLEDRETAVVAVAVEPIVAVAAPTPMVAGVDLPVPSTDSGALVIVQSRISIETQEDETTVVAVTVEPIVAVAAPIPMVAGTDSSELSMNSGVELIVQPQIQIETPEEVVPEGPVVVVEEMNDEAMIPAMTVVIGSSEIEPSANAVETETLAALNTQENRPDQVQSPKAGAEVASVTATRSSADEQVTKAPTTVTLSEQDAYDQAFNMLKQSRYKDAAEEFANFLRQYRNSQLTDDAWYWMAEAYYVTRDFERALIGFNTVVSYFSNSPRIPASRLKIGYIQYETADYDEARETLTQLLKEFPAHRVAVSAETRLKKMDRERR
jgi:tol-pal system protein YbgF